MEKILESLYDQFYEKPKMTALQASVEANRNLLRERLANPERCCGSSTMKLRSQMRCHWTVFSADLSWRGG